MAVVIRNYSYITPAIAPVSYTCWRVFVPNDETFKAALNELISYLCNQYAWVENGGISAQQASELYCEQWARLIEDYCMIGSIFAYATTNPPPNCLECDGTSYSGDDYPELFAVIADEFKSGNNFTVPDLRGKFVLGVSGSHPVASSGGSETHTLDVSEMPAHSHTDLGHAHTEVIAAPNVTTIGPGSPQPTAVPSAGVTGIGSANLDNAGGGQSHNNMPPYMALKYAMVAK